MLPPAPPSGRFDGAVHLFPVRVYFEDTDLSGVVYHANYLRWFERARSDLLRRLEINQRAAIEEGGVFGSDTQFYTEGAPVARFNKIQFT